MTAPASARPRDTRLVWLDIARFLSALMILGIHWLRACYKVGLFGRGDRSELVMDYQSHAGGLPALAHHALIAGTGLSPAVWLTNLIGVLGGFGWEAVSALILISGFSLTVAQRENALSPRGWITWYEKRAKRVLIPFYLVAFTFLLAYGIASFALPHLGTHAAAVADAKMRSQFDSPWLGVVLSHTLLFDPFARDWSADFFAPAWWFIPAILLAYVLFPFARAAANVGRGIPLLVTAALVSIAAFSLADRGVLINETWYYIVLQESFNFCLGIVVGRMWLGPQRVAVDRALGDGRVAAAAFLVFVLGNVANWSPDVRPVASMLYGPSLVVVLAFLAKRCERRPNVARALTSVDPYDLYLVHQPFAFPIALLAAGAFHGYAVFVGWFAFVAVAVVASNVLTVAQRRFTVARPIGRAPVERRGTALRTGSG